MRLGTRPEVVFPTRYKGHRLVRSRGRVFGVPNRLDFDELLPTEQFYAHPAIVSAGTLDEVLARIDHPEQTTQLLGVWGDFDVVQHRGKVYAVPHTAAGVDLDVPRERRRAGVIEGRTREEVEERLLSLGQKAPIEFAGWLPIYELVGNCGQHPQFSHTDEPPPGYRFTYSAPPESGRKRSLLSKAFGWVMGQIRRVMSLVWLMLRPLFALCFGGKSVGVIARLRVFAALVRLSRYLLAKGASPWAVLRFLQTRHFQSQLLLANHPGPVFYTSMPFTLNLQPWVIEIEDPTTLFFPFVHNGRTCNLDMQKLPIYPVVKAMLESDQCKAIVTHMESTARMLPSLFRSEIISRKVMYRPLGTSLPTRWQRHQGRDDQGEIHLLFINSWCQVPNNFFLRGGLDILEAFAILRERYPQLRLTMRTALPALDNHYHRILESGWVRVIQRFFTAEEMAQIHAESHIFLLPAARVHIVSLLQAMSYGLAVVGSDGWGMEEYLQHEHNGLIVKGRYGKVSWADEQGGMLREDYSGMYTSNPDVVEEIVVAVSRLVEDRELRARLGHNAREDVRTKFTLAQWNQGLKEVFDRATQVAERV